MVARKDLKDALRLVEDIFLRLTNRGVKVLVDEAVAGLCRNPEVRGASSTLDALKKADFIITVGGDGTILWTVKRLKPPLKILGINMGFMGFLCEVEVNEVPKFLDKVLAGDYYLQRANLLSVKIDGVERGQALNDVLIFTSKLAKVVGFTLKSDGVGVFSGKADGALVSTTVGSSAYVVSAGGPLVDPLVQCIVVTVLNPLKLGVRPLVLPQNSVIQVSFPKDERRGAAVYSDGTFTELVKAKSTIEIASSSMYVEFMRIKDLRSEFYRKFYDVRIRGGKEA
ncbi:MAG: NAD(+)/NADH kinase [Candidatus Nezhaarchaeota archaeon]|nr:NAD(+)/NADH kinase [Candidatus Nezhaarchaeota archaeon]